MNLLLILLLLAASSLGASEGAPQERPSFAEETASLGAGVLFKSASFLAEVTWGLTSLSRSPFSQECLLFKELCDSVSKHFLEKKSSSFDSSQTSWKLNQDSLSTIQAISLQEEELLLFLTHSFLAKSTGFFSSLVDWVYPKFGIAIQIHPETSGFYSRSPFIKLPKAYQKKVASWKEELSHPEHYPLLLTRPSDLGSYLPSYIQASISSSFESTAKQIKESLTQKTVIDCSNVSYKSYQRDLLKACKKEGINPQNVVCVQRVSQKEIGGLRILPRIDASIEEVKEQHQFLLNWLSTFGLSANRIELDRSLSHARTFLTSKKMQELPLLDKDSFASFLDSYAPQNVLSHPQKNLITQGTVSALKGLLQAVSETQWEKIKESKTLSQISSLSFYKIQQELLALAENDSTFFDAASRLEQVHAHLSALLEVFSPFESKSFSSFYKNRLTSLPPSLKEMTQCALHSSAMTSLAGIFQAAKSVLGKAPSTIYGPNIYYECVNAANLASQNATPMEKALEKDWEHVDLLLAQFHPVWKALSLEKTLYGIEDVSAMVHKALSTRKDKPLILALDCTVDFIDSPRVAKLLTEFEEEIKQGRLSVLCYRSGLKFDLFGMDNYCGAPFYKIHSQDPKWDGFSSLLEDPVLQTDTLSHSWFCLAYQTSANELDLYRKQIFDNTRALLQKIPSRLLEKSDLPYRVIPFQEGANTAFVDITLTGPFHRARAEALISGYLTVHCMEQGLPLFYRISLGLYHTNLTQLSDKHSSTIRLTLGLDPAQIDVLTECFEKIDSLNGP